MIKPYRTCAIPKTTLLTLLLAALLANAAVAETVIMEFKGSASRNTPEFEVRAPWILEWRVSTEGAYQAAVEVSLLEAGTGVHQGRVLMTKFPGSGVKLFEEYSGKYYFRVDSSFVTWTLKVIELTEDEAEQYTPR